MVILGIIGPASLPEHLQFLLRGKSAVVKPNDGAPAGRGFKNKKVN
jgi:hypothetical protein